MILCNRKAEYADRKLCDFAILLLGILACKADCYSQYES